MLLTEHLEEYTKEQLLEQARSFELRKCLGLRKAALIERILECFCAEDMLRSRLACLTKEQMILFRKAHNNTRMKENRGHKPNELIRRELAGGIPTIVPGSSHATAMLRDAAPQLKEMGIPE